MEGQQTGAQKGRSFPALLEGFRENFSSMQQPADLIILMTYCMTMYAPIRICIEAGVFRRLAASPQPVAAGELAKSIDGLPEPDSEQEAAEREEFLARMIRAACALNLVDEAGPYIYLGNELTRTLADPGFEAGFIMIFENTFGPHSVVSHLYSWAKDNAYKAPTSSLDGPFQQAKGIVGKSTFQYWVHDDPPSMSNLSALMKRIQQDRLNWSAWFPANILFASTKADTSGGNDSVFMVDVGGGLGHDLSGFAERYPDKSIQLVLQDQPEVIQEAKDQRLDPRIRLLNHSFFEPQPIKSAEIYFMHKIMHDWPDRECIQILSHLRDAMSPESRIFINDVILPDQGSPLIFAAFDVGMLAWLSAKERSESMWKRLISQVDGLVIRNFWQAPGLKGEGIVEVGRAP